MTTALISSKLQSFECHESCTRVEVSGRLKQATGLLYEVEGLPASVGSCCAVAGSNGDEMICEVVGFRGHRSLLMAIDTPCAVKPNALVRLLSGAQVVLMGDGLIGRVIDGFGRPLDDKGPLINVHPCQSQSEPINPMTRRPISEQLDVGVQALNGVCAIGEGQRVGLMAGSGVGKSVLLSMMTRFTSADVVVVALVGERGREVREFIYETLGEEGLANAVIVTAPADQSPLMRMRCAELASDIAAHFRSKNRRVLLLMDSLTRYAQALREVGLAVGEPPTTKGYPPSVFSKLPRLVERAGTSDQNDGSVTGVYTVLAEGDDQTDPIVDAARAILDGHIVLSRSLAEQGHFPAIDIRSSVSRVMLNIVTEEQILAANRLKELLSNYEDNRDLISVGAYMKGSNLITDQAIEFMPLIVAYLKQSHSHGVSCEDAASRLSQLIGAIDQNTENRGDT